MNHASSEGADSAQDRIDRYAKQVRFAALGQEGQLRLENASALIVGCGALGSVTANTLARAGVGRLRIVESSGEVPSVAAHHSSSSASPSPSADGNKAPPTYE